MKEKTKTFLKSLGTNLLGIFVCISISTVCLWFYYGKSPCKCDIRQKTETLKVVDSVSTNVTESVKDIMTLVGKSEINPDKVDIEEHVRKITKEYLDARRYFNSISEEDAELVEKCMECQGELLNYMFGKGNVEEN